MTKSDFQPGDRVRCLAGDIDRGRHAGEIGEIDGFVRISSYHTRERHGLDKKAEI